MDTRMQHHCLLLFNEPMGRVCVWEREFRHAVCSSQTQSTLICCSGNTHSLSLSVSSCACFLRVWILWTVAARLKITHDASGCRWWARLPEVPAQHLRLHPLPRLLTTETPAQHLQRRRARARAARICRAQRRERHQRQGETDRQRVWLHQ